MRTVKRIVKIHKRSGYKMYCLFNNGESRIIDFEKLFESWDLNEKSKEYTLMSSLEAFGQVELAEGTLSWPNIKIKSKDEDGKEIEYIYDLDPIVLYENSVADKERNFEIGILIKLTRKQMGLTQEELANKSGTSKHYISRLENNKTGIELATLQKIIEGGLGKRMQINLV